MKKIIALVVFIMSISICSAEEADENKNIIHSLQNDIINFIVQNHKSEAILRGGLLYGKTGALLSDVLEKKKDGILIYSIPIKSGKVDGIVHFYNTRNLELIIHYVNGKKTGRYNRYYPDGELMISALFDDDKPVDKVETYYQSGKLKTYSKYKKNNTIYEETYYENGNIFMKQTLKKEIKIGNNEIYYKNGGIVAKREYLQDGKLLKLSNYYENGNIAAEIDFINNEPVNAYRYDAHGNKSEMTRAHITNLQRNVDELSKLKTVDLLYSLEN